MEPSPTSSPTPALEPKKRRGCLGLFFKSALGCTAFAIGSLVVFVLLLPSLCGSLAASAIERQFHERYQGSLAVGAVELSWKSPQEVRDVVLRTPDNNEVARASLTLPSLLDLLRSGGERFGKIHVTVNADLVADDAGITNLERALAPTGAKPKVDTSSTDATIQTTTDLAALDLDLEISSQRLSWSDSETRRVGAPFEIRDFTAALVAHPGQPIAAHAHATIASDTPGELALEAKVHDLLAKDQKWPWGRIDTQISIKGFSSAMLDGLANQHGRLKELLGPRFDLTVDALGATPDAGDVILALESEAAKVHLGGRFQGGAFHLSSAADQGVTIPLPRSYIEAFVTPHLPPNSKLVFAAASEQGSPSTQLWTVHVNKLELPIPDLAARDLKSLEPYLERLVCDVLIDLPAGIGFEDPSMSSGNGTPSLQHSRFGIRVAPGEPLVAGLSAELEMNGKANVGAEITLRDPWKALAAGSLPRADAHLEITDIGTAGLDALMKQGGKLAGALGPKLSLRVRAKDVSRESGTCTVELGAEHFDLAWSGKIEQGRIRSSGVDALVLRADPPAGSIEALVAPYLPAGMEVAVTPGPMKLDVRDVTYVLPTGPRPAGDTLGLLRGALAVQLSCDLPALRISNESTRAAELPLEIGAAHLALNLGLDGKCVMALKSTLDTVKSEAAKKGTLSVTASTGDVWKLAAAKGLADLPPTDAKLVLEGLSTAAVGRLAGEEGLVTGVLGPNVSITMEARDATANSGSLRLDVAAPQLKLAFTGKLEGGALHCTGQDGLELEANPSSEFIARDLGSFLPAGASVRLEESNAAPGAQPIVAPGAQPKVAPGAQPKVANGAQPTAQRKPLRVSLREALLPLPDAGSSAKLGTPAIAALMERASGKLRVDIDRLVYSDPRTQSAKIAVALDALALSLDIAPKKALAIKLDAGIEAGGKGVLAGELTVKDPWLALKTEPAGFPAIEGKLNISGLPSASLDALAGQKEMLAKLFGPAIELDAAVSATSLEQGAFHIDVKSPSTTLTSSGRLDKGAIVCSGAQGLDLNIHFPAGWLEEQVSPYLPVGTRLSAPSDASPLTLSVRDVRVELPSSFGQGHANKSGSAQDASSGMGKGKSPKGTPPNESATKGSPPDDSSTKGTPASESAAKGSSASESSAKETSAKAAVPSTEESMRATLSMVSKLSLRASLTVPTLSYADAKTDAAKQPVSIRDLAASIDLVPGKPPAATLHAKLEAETPGDLSVTLRALDPLEKLADAKGLDTFRIFVDVGGAHVPTAIVDALAGQNGLLVDALGARLEIAIKSESLSRDQGSFVATLSSEQHSMRIVEGHFEHGDLVIDKDGGLIAKVGLTPLVSQRIVGNLVPMLLDVQKPQGSDPASFAVDSLRWPKDGDLGKLDAVVRVNLGEVSYRLLPALEAVLGSSVPKTVKLPELRVPIQHGVASYTGLPIKIGGRDFVFKGSFNLKDQSFNLGTDVPLSLLGKNVEKQLDSLRGVLSPDTLVPIEIRGTWKNPRIGIGNDFLKHVLEDAAKKELPGLLEGLLKKKKKD